MDKNILVVGDLHLKLSNVKTMDNFFDYLKEIVREKGVKTLIFLGDLYDGKALIHVDVQTMLLNKMKNFVEQQVYIIVGNHDFASTNLGNHSLKPLELFSNIKIIDTYDIVDEYLLMAYGKTAELEGVLRKVCRTSNKIRAIFGHFAVNGFMYGSGKEVDDGVDPKLLTVPTILGHIHSAASIDNVLYLGTPISQTFGEANQLKKILLIQDDGMELIEVSDIFPRHISIKWQDSDAAKFKSNDFLRVTDVPVRDREEAKKKYAEIQDVRFEFISETNNVVRIDPTKSHEVILKEYIEKNFISDRFKDLDKKKLFKLGKRYLEEE